ncbi:MarR family transcriptional regulator [Candidatus Woesearchaeota archaeon]|nr:MarR family transcriptional regulator [Candidatus Woesearchaeota archaeon]MBL7050864.1 MarR family transcriptional regulator [Candidatus Woesearchaeota archaeon]
MAVSFACKHIEFAEIIKCSFDLNKTEYNLLLFLINSKRELDIKEISEKLSLDRSTIQKAMKLLTQKDLVKRIQTNLENGGYVFFYIVKNKQEIKSKILQSVDNWHNSVKKLIINW